MGYRALITLLLLTSISSCASHKSQIKPQRPALLTDVYAQTTGDTQADVAKFVEENLKEQKTFGYVQPYIPVIEQPVVRKVWIPDHKSKDDPSFLVGGHWVYLMVKGPQWSINDSSDSLNTMVVPAKPMEVKKQ